MDLLLTGAITPDANGLYVEAGVYDEQPYYRRGDSAWFIWSPYGAGYYLSSVLGSTPDEYWYKEVESNPVGNYIPLAGAVGEVNVAQASDPDIVLGQADYLGELLYGHNNHLACI